MLPNSIDSANLRSWYYKSDINDVMTCCLQYLGLFSGLRLNFVTSIQKISIRTLWNLWGDSVLAVPIHIVSQWRWQRLLWPSARYQQFPIIICLVSRPILGAPLSLRYRLLIVQAVYIY